MTNWVRLLSICAVSMTAASASAQIQPRAFKLSLDTSLLSFTRVLVEEGGDSQTDTVLNVGPMGAASGIIPGYVALGFGYVAHKHVIPELQLGFGVATVNSKAKSEFDAEVEEPRERLSEVMLRPMLEVPINPDSRFVLAGVVGLDYRLLKYAQEADSAAGEDEFSSKIRGLGPVLGVTTHFFVVERASIDLGALFTYHALKTEAEIDGVTESDDADKRNSLTFGLTLGLSLWPGPRNPSRTGEIVSE